MKDQSRLPHILVIDDLFGRSVARGINFQRRSLCAQYLISDLTGDENAETGQLTIPHPLATVTFCRGQIPACAEVGDIVRNDLDGTLELIARLSSFGEDESPLSLILLDL